MTSVPDILKEISPKSPRKLLEDLVNNYSSNLKKPTPIVTVFTYDQWQFSGIPIKITFDNSEEILCLQEKYNYEPNSNEDDLIFIQVKNISGIRISSSSSIAPIITDGKIPWPLEEEVPGHLKLKKMVNTISDKIKSEKNISIKLEVDWDNIPKHEIINTNLYEFLTEFFNIFPFEDSNICNELNKYESFIISHDSNLAMAFDKEKLKIKLSLNFMKVLVPSNFSTYLSNKLNSNL